MFVGVYYTCKEQTGQNKKVKNNNKFLLTFLTE